MSDQGISGDHKKAGGNFSLGWWWLDIPGSGHEIAHQNAQNKISVLNNVKRPRNSAREILMFSHPMIF